MNLYRTILYSNLAADGNGNTSNTDAYQTVPQLRVLSVDEPKRPYNHGCGDNHGSFGNYEHEVPRGRESPLAD